MIEDNFIKKGYYVNKISFNSYPKVDGIISIESDNKEFNDFVEIEIKHLLKDIYEGKCRTFKL